MRAPRSRKGFRRLSAFQESESVVRDMKGGAVPFARCAFVSNLSASQRETGVGKTDDDGVFCAG